MEQARCSPQRPVPAEVRKYRPYRDRVFRAIKRTPISELSASCSKLHSSRPSHYRLGWDQQTMKTALESVIYGGMSLSNAAKVYNIPKSTLFDHKIGSVLPGVKSGHPTLLSSEEEDDLVSFIIECASIGYPKSQLEVIAMAKMIAVKNSEAKDRKLTNGWWQSFIKRHPTLSLKMATPLSSARAIASSPENLLKYFDLLEDTMKRYNLSSDPALVFNMDESGFPLNPKPLKGIFVRGTNACAVTSNDKSQITVVGCVSAAGQCLPPMIVWPRKKMKPELAAGEIPGTVYGLVERGWMTQELFSLWFHRHFLRYAPAARPLLLLLDGHSSHYCPETLRLAQEEDVIMFALPPNTTHLSQPLDKGAFGPLKLRWRQVVHDFRVSHPYQSVTQFNFCSLFSKAWVEAMTPMNICSGFKTTGIHPFNPNALIEKIPCQKSDTYFESQDHLAFTPAKCKIFATEEELNDNFLSSSAGQYSQSCRQGTMQMHNIENVPTRDFKKQGSRVRDPSGKIISSTESVKELEDRRKARLLKQQGKRTPKKDGRKSTSSLFKTSCRSSPKKPLSVAKDIQDVEQIDSPSDLSSDELLSLTCWIRGLNLSMNDKKVLRRGRCLTGNHINAAHHLLQTQFPGQNGLQDTHYLHVCKKWESVPENFVQIVFLNTTHWVCLSNISCKKGHVNLFDSMISIPTETDDVVQQLCTILKSLYLTVVNINIVNVRQQVGGTDCGLFAVAIATDLCYGMDPFCAAYIQDDMRLHLETCFQSGILSPFPAASRQIVDRVYHTLSVKLYCLCCRPEGDELMVQCDKCDLWFHECCVVDPTSLDLDSVDKWFCPSCESGTPSVVNKKVATAGCKGRTVQSRGTGAAIGPQKDLSDSCSDSAVVHGKHTEVAPAKTRAGCKGRTVQSRGTRAAIGPQEDSDSDSDSAVVHGKHKEVAPAKTRAGCKGRTVQSRGTGAAIGPQEDSDSAVVHGKHKEVAPAKTRAGCKGRTVQSRGTGAAIDPQKDLSDSDSDSAVVHGKHTEVAPAKTRGEVKVKTHD